MLYYYLVLLCYKVIVVLETERLMYWRFTWTYDLRVLTIYTMYWRFTDQPLVKITVSGKGNTFHLFYISELSSRPWEFCTGNRKPFGLNDNLDLLENFLSKCEHYFKVLNFSNKNLYGVPEIIFTFLKTLMQKSILFENFKK